MTDLFDYTRPADQPNAPYARGSDTSKAAAENVSASVGYMEKLVLDALAAAGTAGLICEEVERKTGLPHQTCSARLRGLELKGCVRKTEGTRLTTRGYKATVYRSVEAQA